MKKFKINFCFSLLLLVFISGMKLHAGSYDSLRSAGKIHLKVAFDLLDSGKYLEAGAAFEAIGHTIESYNDSTHGEKIRSKYFYLAAVAYTQILDTADAFRLLEHSIAIGEKESFQISSDDQLVMLRSFPHWKKLQLAVTGKLQLTTPFFLWGTFFGIMLILCVYNLILFISIRERSYLYLSLSVFAWLSLEATRSTELNMHLSKTIFAWLAKIHPASGDYVFTPLLVTIIYLLFVRSFLDTRNILPKADRWLKALVIIYLVSTLSGYFVEAMKPPIVYPFFIITYFYCFILGIRAWRKGYRAARYFVLANVFFVTGLTCSVLGSLGAPLPLTIGVFYVDNFGSVLFFTLLSLAQGDKINVLKKETIEAQEKALVVLEQKVAERTAELTHQKAIVEEKQKDILDSINYAGRIQKSLLPTEKYIERNLNKKD